MKKIEKKFNEVWKEIAYKCSKQYKLVLGNNARFVAETIYKEFKNKQFFTYAECGVFTGTTFFPIYHLCKTLFQNFRLYALDSFSGFPKDITLNPNDEFENFEIMYENGSISEDHLIRARERCGKIPNKEHLQVDYFKDYAEEFYKRCEGKKEIQIVKTSFSDLDKNLETGSYNFDLVFLDCDLYLSYTECLDFFKDKTKLFVFDEYSLLSKIN